MSDRNARLYEEVTQQILDALDTGVSPWRKSWASTGEQLRSTGEPYKGVNQFLLGLRSMSRGYASPYWLTFNQAKALDACVRKGERCTHVVFFKTLEKEREGSEEPDRFRLMRQYAVFNATQIDGLPDRFFPVIEVRNTDKRQADIDEQLMQHNPVIKEGEPAYWPTLNHITMPAFERFDTGGAYYATLSHELVHWTKHKDRLEREVPSYAFEELVAEIGACFMVARLRIEGEHIDNHASYIAAWKKQVRDDPRAIFRAAALAQEAVDWLLPPITTEGEDE